MKSIAHLRHLRIAPRKMRLAADLIRKKRVLEAKAILAVISKKGAEPLRKLLNSAAASAKQKSGANEDVLYISEIRVDEGPKLKRFRARARGQAYPIQKKTSHITLILDEIEGVSRERAETLEEKEVPQEALKEEKIVRTEKPQFERPEEDRAKPKTVRALPKIFRRKAI